MTISEVNLQNADLRSAEFEWKNLSQNNNLRYVKITVNDFVYRIYHEWDKEGNMKWSSLNERLHETFAKSPKFPSRHLGDFS